VRREVLGAEYVDASLANADDFMMPFQRLLTEWAWAEAWSRPGLDRRTRSMLNLAMLTALGRFQELGIYVKGALSTGVSVDEIQEVLLHATVYCGTPAGRQAFLATTRQIDGSATPPRRLPARRQRQRARPRNGRRTEAGAGVSE
jgi:4-carboxymuconolactone decarboxylase